MMLTRCPECATVFRVTPDQLKARQGRVRCGRCHRVFNAIDALIENVPATLASSPEPEAPGVENRLDQAPTLDLEELSEAAAPSDVATDIDAVSPSASGQTQRLEDDSVPPPVAGIAETPDSEAEAIAIEAPDMTSDEEPSKVTEALLANVDGAPQNDETSISESALLTDPLVAEASSVESLPPLEPLLQEPPRKVLAQSWSWFALSGLLLALAVWQVALFYRVNLAIQFPPLRPVFASVCDTIGCDMPLPRRIDLVSIEASDLNPDAPREGRLRLTAMLKNRADFAQEYPYLELTLTDTKDQPLLRRALAPSEYLAAPPLASGFSAGGELSVALTIEAGGVPATGYRLYVFYP
jgi:predicted Zn finger-like uncharacterized protein